MEPSDAENICLCRICPSYVECGEPTAFCLGTNPSKCINAEAGCLCLGCPLWVKKAFRHVYFCTRGAEIAQ
ncbi:DUF2769 domain-containing protein [Dehalogenimonas alkenigignens]|uniref:DUF2769 domain-containing protein n=1 Tax=Dehalogenimonas alkenigignens TaxID=1217799 RepID=A0A0W0GK66_9CHLR|nr:DUF2769 domain-containing protein [Dehalogenimonas alkenigignens]KTB48915.1 Protein of unknown function (DUF2769) [Dehalogenimonas alkenigignens]